MNFFQLLKVGDYMKTITRTKYLDRIIELNGTPDIKIITGIRRSGKSKLMQAYIEYLKIHFENINIIFIDFMDLTYEEIREYHALHAYVEEHYQAGKTNYLFVDEVQMCPKFELAINSLYSKGKYEESYDLWDQVIEANSNSNFAYHELTRNLYQLRDYSSTMKYAINCGDATLYAKAFSATLNDYIRKNFAWIAILCIVGGLVIIAAATYFRKRKKGKR